MMLDLAAVALLGLAGYGIVFYLAHQYGLRMGWKPPDETPAMKRISRRAFGFALGGLAVLLCAGFAVTFIGNWPGRVLAVAQAVLLASAGASDLHRFQLPLPVTMAGIILAVVSWQVVGMPVIFVLFGVFWAAVIIAAHVLLSKGSMQLGDHLATVWIALAMPVNGMLAVLIGDTANVVYARARRLQGQKLAAAGAWLVAAAALMAVPPYFLWTSRLPDAAPASSRPAIPAATASARDMEIAQARNVLIQLSELAAEDTARVALAEDRAERIAAAKTAGASVARLASAAQSLASGSAIAEGLVDLARALEAYDVDAVRDASLRLGQEREKLLTRNASEWVNIK
ncbi:MAG: hypothetical protein ABIQ99_02230 [Thermoflexales bacterium]